MLAAGDSTGAAGAWAGRGVGDVVVWGEGSALNIHTFEVYVQIPRIRYGLV